MSCSHSHPERTKRWHYHNQQHSGQKRCLRKKAFFQPSWYQSWPQHPSFKWSWKSNSFATQTLLRKRYSRVWNSFQLPSWLAFWWVQKEIHSKRATLWCCHHWWSGLNVHRRKSQSNFIIINIRRIQWFGSSNENSLANNCLTQYHKGRRQINSLQARSCKRRNYQRLNERSDENYRLRH